MKKQNWKRMQPTSLPQAIEWSIEHARERHHRSVDQVAELTGLTNKWTLYKYMESGNLPARLILPFENACGIDFISRWLVLSAGKLLIDIPTGRGAKAIDIQALQELLNDVVGRLIKFYAQKANVDETLGAIQNAMGSLAWHRGNVEKHMTPELEFDHE